MKAYVINLDRSPERLKFIEDQAQELGLEFERIPAVDGRTLSSESIKDAVSKEFEFQPINAFEIGLFMSHRIAWERMLQGEFPYAAIFEDDVVLSAGLASTLAAVDKERPDSDVIKLETTLRKIVCTTSSLRLSSGDQLHRLLTWHGGTAGYIISRRGAEIMLQNKRLLSDQIDQAMFNPLSRVSSQLKILQLVPAACIQKDILEKDSASSFGSTIQRDGSRGKVFRHGPLIDLRRMYKKHLERLRRQRLAKLPMNSELLVPFASASSDSATHTLAPSS